MCYHYFQLISERLHDLFVHACVGSFIVLVCVSYFIALYSPINKNPSFGKQRSTENAPSLPRDGAQRMAKKTPNGNQQADFLKTPEAGIAG